LNRGHVSTLLAAVAGLALSSSAISALANATAPAAAILSLLAGMIAVVTDGSLLGIFAAAGVNFAHARKRSITLADR